MERPAPPSFSRHHTVLPPGLGQMHQLPGGGVMIPVRGSASSVLLFCRCDIVLFRPGLVLPRSAIFCSCSVLVQFWSVPVAMVRSDSFCLVPVIFWSVTRVERGRTGLVGRWRRAGGVVVGAGAAGGWRAAGGSGFGSGRWGSTAANLDDRPFVCRSGPDQSRPDWANRIAPDRLDTGPDRTRPGWTGQEGGKRAKPTLPAILSGGVRQVVRPRRLGSARSQQSGRAEILGSWCPICCTHPQQIGSNKLLTNG
eukprot:gene17433-biopygen8331